MTTRRDARYPIALALAAVMIMTAATDAGAACRTIDGKPRFEVSGNEARDRAGGLVWRRCPLGTTWADGRCNGDQRYLSLDEAEAAVRAEGSGWRLPDVKELYELLDDGCGTPPVDTTAFPAVGIGDVEADGFWTSSALDIAELWYFVNLTNGIADGHSRGFRLAVLPVKKAH